MASSVPKEEENLVFDIRLSSVVPGKITGENKTYELKGIDLAMKLHYLKGLYFFTNTNDDNNASEEGNNTRTKSFVSIREFKSKAMFDCLISYFKACGRIRLSSTETGERPSIKLNDAGVRIVEARSNKTVEEWLAMEGFGVSMDDQLVYNHGLGPDLSFSPLVCLQVTWFKCGGISVGLSWAHVLGDAFSASEFMNMLGQYMQGYIQQPKTLQDPPQSKSPPPSPAPQPISVKRVDPVGNHWILPSNCKIGTYTIHLTPKQLGQLYSRVYGSKMNGNGSKTSSQYFEVITSTMWKSIANIRKDMDTQIVTICRSKINQRQQVIPYNGQILSTLMPQFPISSADPLTLVNLIVERIIDESNMIEEIVNKEASKCDFYVYGANLTFVDMEESSIYGFLMKGKNPRFASYTISEVGDKGAVLVLPGPKEGNDANNGSKLIVLLLPENEIAPLKNELKKEWCIA